MDYQFDWQKRVVSLANLTAMCDRVSGVCHNYHVVKVSENRIHVMYSNPDEYGCDHPMTAVFPAYRDSRFGIATVMEILRVEHDNWDGEGWQAFDCLMDCPTLHRLDGKWYAKGDDFPRPADYTP